MLDLVNTLPNECRPRAGGDAYITKDRGAFGNGSPPAQGRQNKEPYIQDEALANYHE